MTHLMATLASTAFSGISARPVPPAFAGCLRPNQTPLQTAPLPRPACRGVPRFLSRAADVSPRRPVVPVRGARRRLTAHRSWPQVVAGRQAATGLPGPPPAPGLLWLPFAFSSRRLIERRISAADLSSFYIQELIRAQQHLAHPRQRLVVRLLRRQLLVPAALRLPLQQRRGPLRLLGRRPARDRQAEGRLDLPLP